MKRILVIDDDRSIREALNKLLRGEGYDTLLAANSDQALAHFGCGNVDLLLLDLNLPTKNGWDLFERFTEINPLVPIIIITGRADQSALAAGAGVGALLEKPVDVDFLLKSIRDLLAETNETRLHRLLGNNHSLRYASAALLKGRKAPGTSSRSREGHAGIARMPFVGRHH